MRSSHLRTPLLAIALGVAAVACGGGDGDGDQADAGGAATESPSVTVTIADFAFEPADVEVGPGAPITFDNVDDAGHNATIEDTLDTDLIAAGERAEVTAPEEPGTYEYFCDLHPFMKGTITVG